MCPNVMVPLQIDLAMAFDGICSVACLAQGVPTPGDLGRVLPACAQVALGGSANRCVRFRI